MKKLLFVAVLLFCGTVSAEQLTDEEVYNYIEQYEYCFRVGLEDEWWEKHGQTARAQHMYKDIDDAIGWQVYLQIREEYSASPKLLIFHWRLLEERWKTTCLVQVDSSLEKSIHPNRVFSISNFLKQQPRTGDTIRKQSAEMVEMLKQLEVARTFGERKKIYEEYGF